MDLKLLQENIFVIIFSIVFIIQALFNLRKTNNNKKLEKKVKFEDYKKLDVEFVFKKTPLKLKDIG